jgi:hypothetical protein
MTQEDADRAFPINEFIQLLLGIVEGYMDSSVNHKPIDIHPRDLDRINKGLRAQGICAIKYIIAIKPMLSLFNIKHFSNNTFQISGVSSIRDSIQVGNFKVSITFNTITAPIRFGRISI